MSEVSAVDKGLYSLLEQEICPSNKAKGIVDGASTSPAALISKEEEDPALRGNDIPLSPVSVPMEGVSKEE